MPRRFHIADDVRRERRIFLVTPSVVGATSPYYYSLLKSVDLLRAQGFSVDWMHLEGHCHVDDARNDLVRAFLETDCTDLVFIDSDVGWRPHDLFRLVSVDRDYVAGIYPKKRDGADYPCMLLPGENRADEEGLLEVARVPTGFLRLSRRAIERLYNAAPDRFLGPMDAPDRVRQAIIFERTFADGNRLSGDYAVSDKWRALGGKVYIDPEMVFVHQGPQEWTGCYGAHLRRENDLTVGYCLERIGNDTADGTVYQEMVDGWGNYPWSASVSLLITCVEIARDGAGPILECGSGLTTLVMAAAAPHRTVHALEHDPLWAKRVVDEAQKNGLANVVMHCAPLRDGWYDTLGAPDLPTLLVVDGPPRQLADRFLVYDRVPLAPGSIVIADDAQEPHKFEATGLGFHFFDEGTQKPYAVAVIRGLAA